MNIIDNFSDALKAWWEGVFARFGYPDNATGIQVVIVTIRVVNQAINLPNMPIPRGYGLVIKARFTNAGLIRVAPNQTAAPQATQSYTLQANEFITYRVKNPQNNIWISGNAAGDVVELTSEFVIGR